MMVCEQCPQPFVHDLEITVVPFLRVFVDPSGSKNGGVIEERDRKVSAPFKPKGGLGKTAPTCARCGAFSRTKHISASPVSLLRNSRRNSLILQRKAPGQGR